MGGSLPGKVSPLSWASKQNIPCAEVSWLHARFPRCIWSWPMSLVLRGSGSCDGSVGRGGSLNNLTSPGCAAGSGWCSASPWVNCTVPWGNCPGSQRPQNFLCLRDCLVCCCCVLLERQWAILIDSVLSIFFFNNWFMWWRRCGSGRLGWMTFYKV